MQDNHPVTGAVEGRNTPTPWRAILKATAFLASVVTLPACSSPSSPIHTDAIYEGSTLSGAARDFSLIDQNNQPISLSDFRGEVVVLTFMDSQCKEVCPLTAVHLRSVAQSLGAENPEVVFLGVNVNAAANAVPDVAIPTEEWKLDEIPTWHFLTGERQQLEAVWEAYGIGVVLPAQEGEELVHTPGVFLIDKTGQKRWYISTPFDETGEAQSTQPLSELLLKHIHELLAES